VQDFFHPQYGDLGTPPVKEPTVIWSHLESPGVCFRWSLSSPKTCPCRAFAARCRLSYSVASVASGNQSRLGNHQFFLFDDFPMFITDRDKIPMSSQMSSHSFRCFLPWIYGAYLVRPPSAAGGAQVAEGRLRVLLREAWQEIQGDMAMDQYP